MRTSLFTAASLAVLGMSFAASQVATAEDGKGWYLRGNAGYGAHTDADFDQSILRGDIESQGNVAASLGLGYDFGENWRLELDGDTLWTDMGKVGNQPASYAKLRTNTAMLNAIYDFSDFGKFEPYVGAGIGFVQGNLKAEAHDFANGNVAVFNPACLGGQSGTCTVNDKATSLGWQLLAGAGYNLTDKLVWDTHYSYMNTTSGGLDFDGSYVPNAGNLAALNHKTELNGVGAHTVMTGLRYRFGQTAKPMPVVQAPAPVPTPDYTCWDGVMAFSASECAPRPAPTPTFTCWDNSIVSDQALCTPRPAPRSYTCWDGSTTTDINTCPAQPQQIVQPYNNCGPSNVAIFDVPLNQTPKQMTRLGTMPEFGDSHGLSPQQFFEKLQRRYSASKMDKAYLDYLFKSMGYSNGFSDAQSYMFSEDVLPVGTRGILGLGKSHHYAYSILPSNDRDRQAFRIQSANGSVIHFMKTCGNYMYACN